MDVHESDSGYESEPEVVVKKAAKAKGSKRKRNDKEEEEYEIYEKTIKERAAIWEHYDPVRMKNDPNTRRALCKFCKKTLAADGPSNGTSSLHKHYPCPKNPKYVSKKQKQQQTILEFKKKKMLVVNVLVLCKLGNMMKEGLKKH